MDQATRIAEELNHGSATPAVWQEFLDGDLTSDDEHNNDQDCITLENVPSLQMGVAGDDDEEECVGLAAEELNNKVAEAIAAVTLGDKDSEMEKIRNFACNCHTTRKDNSVLGTQSCSQKLPPDLMYKMRLDSVSAERQLQDMRIIGHLEANRRTVDTYERTTSTKRIPSKRKCPRTSYTIGGIEVCKNTFLFLMA